MVIIPEIAAFPDAIAQAGEGADGGGVIAHALFLLRFSSQDPTCQIIKVDDDIIPQIFLPLNDNIGKLRGRRMGKGKRRDAS